MSVEPLQLKGVVQNGVIVLDAPYPLPDGTQVEVMVTRHVLTLEEQTEFEMWERLGDEAWAMIEEWENAQLDERATKTNKAIPG